MEPVTCDNCGKLQCKEKRLRCSRCKTSYYCNKSCQTNHWRKEHKYNCNKKEKMLTEIEKIIEFDAILKKDGILSNNDGNEFEHIEWECKLKLLNKLSQKYYDHYQLLISGYIRMNMSKEDRDKKYKNFIVHNEYKYQLMRRNVILLYESKENNNNNNNISCFLILFDLILYFMTPPLIIPAKNNNI